MTVAAAKDSPPDLLAILRSLENYEDVEFDNSLVAAIQHDYRVAASGVIQFYLPSFKRYQSEALVCGQKDQWPAFSITGPECKLQCDHCKAGILAPMIAATTPELLWEEVNRRMDKGARGMLLSGGSNHRNVVEYTRFLPVLRRLKQQTPTFHMAVHTGLVDTEMAKGLADAGVDVAMLDIIGAQETITQVYHLKRRVEDFEAALAALAATTMKVVPHIVMGLHYGRLLGEATALEVIARHRIDALVLVAVMPQYASKLRPYRELDPHAIGRFIWEARRRLGAVPTLLGCARPAGRAKALIDAYAVMAGVSGIAHPSDGAVALARALGRPVSVSQACCSISTLDSLWLEPVHGQLAAAAVPTGGVAYPVGAMQL